MSSHSGGLPEILSKIIFKKLLETIQKIHMLGIFHFDIKLQNILLDDNFNPILGDFGLSRLKTEAKNGKFIGNFGTRCFKAPQMFLGLDFEGIKADIFSLGATLFNLILGKTIFRFKSKFSQNDKVNYDDKLKELLKDKFYSLIMKNKIYDFWEAVSLKYHPVISPEFKKLIIRMVAFLEKDRPDNIQEILEDEWFKDINNLTPQEEENYILEMKKREELKNSIFNPTENVTSKENENINESNFKISFEDKMTPRTIKEDLKFDTFIRIKGNLNALLFMNSLYQEVAVLFGSEIDEKEKNLKFKIIIKAKKDDDLEEEEDDDDSDNELEKDLIIQVELLKINEQEYILNFIKEKGELSDFYHYVKEIINYAKKYI